MCSPTSSARPCAQSKSIKPIVQAFLELQPEGSRAAAKGTGAILRHWCPEALAAAAGAKLAKELSRRASGLIVTATRLEAQAATAAARASLLATKRVTSEGEIPHLEKMHLTSIEKARTSLYNRGMVVEFSQHSGRFKRGQKWVVTGTNMLGYVELRRGVKLAILPTNRPSRFQVFESQGPLSGYRRADSHHEDISHACRD